MLLHPAGAPAGGPAEAGASSLQWLHMWSAWDPRTHAPTWQIRGRPIATGRWGLESSFEFIFVYIAIAHVASVATPADTLTQCHTRGTSCSYSYDTVLEYGVTLSESDSSRKNGSPFFFWRDQKEAGFSLEDE